MIDVVLQDAADGLPLPWQVVILRLLGAMILAGLIGFERELVDKAAGLRTHMLTGLASCLYSLVMLSILLTSDDLGSHVRVDPVRVVEAVTQGVAFLAAGLIIFTQGEVKGLTTGAGMWLAGAVGLACGLGLWIIAVVATVLALIVIRMLKAVEVSVKARARGAADRHGEKRQGDADSGDT